MPIELLGYVSAGFPSPAGDYLEACIDLNKQCVRRPNATYFFRVKGESMIGAFIPDGALLIIDRIETVKNGSIVLAVVDGDFTVKRYEKKFNKVILHPENPKHKSIELTEEMQSQIWGVVTYIVTDAKTV